MSFFIELFCVVTLQYQILVRIAIAYFIIEKKKAAPQPWQAIAQRFCSNRNLQNYKERIHIMEGRLIAFVIWVIIGVLFIVMGIYDFNSKKAKPFGFWANAEVAPIEDVKGYNRALGILWCVYGVLFTLIGLPLLDGQNSGLIIIPILGAMLISIAAMVAYVVGIEPKYRKKK